MWFSKKIIEIQMYYDDMQNITQKTKDRATRTPGAPEG
jgi:hypothetical protein